MTRKLWVVILVVTFCDHSRGQSPLLPIHLPGVAGGPGTVGVTDYAGGMGTIDDLEIAAERIEQIKAGSLHPHTVASGQYLTADLTDPETHAAGGPIVYETSPWHFPSNTLGDDDDFLSVARGVLRVPESGTYTIQVRSNAGMGFRMIGTPFTAVHGSGELDLDGAMIEPFGANDEGSRGVIELIAGLHEFEFLMWERSGAAYWEITTAQGAHPRTDTARWLALGDRSELSAIGGTSPIATLVDTARVVNLAGTDGGATNDIAAVCALILDALTQGQGLMRDDVTTIVLDDHDGICCLRPGRWVRGAGESFQWPLNDPDFGGDAERDVDFFSSGLFGKLRIDDGDEFPMESHWVTLGLFASDGAQLHLRGASFTDSNLDDALSLKLDGDTVLTYPEFRTGNTNTLGLIQLQEGVDYEWEGFHFEHGQDAGYELWVAQGNQLQVDFTNLDEFLSVFTPLSSSLDALSLPRNQGLALGLLGDYDDDLQLAANDLDLQTLAIRSLQHEVTYDLNHDGLVDEEDRLHWLEQPEMKNTYLGDSNLDGQFDSADIVQVFAAGKFETGQVAFWAEGDWNADRVFDSADFVAAMARGGYEAGPRHDVARAVPEPTGLPLFLFAWLSLYNVRGWSPSNRKTLVE